MVYMCDRTLLSVKGEGNLAIFKMNLEGTAQSEIGQRNPNATAGPVYMTSKKHIKPQQAHRDRRHFDGCRMGEGYRE